jgi:hypothetical protein
VLVAARAEPIEPPAIIFGEQVAARLQLWQGAHHRPVIQAQQARDAAGTLAGMLLDGVPDLVESSLVTFSCHLQMSLLVICRQDRLAMLQLPQHGEMVLKTMMIYAPTHPALGLPYCPCLNTRNWNIVDISPFPAGVNAAVVM